MLILSLEFKPEAAVDALTRISYLARHYQDLQGYRLLPFAAVFLIVALTGSWLSTAPQSLVAGGVAIFWLASNGMPLTLYALAFLASHLIGRAYEARYGRITPNSGTPLAFSRGAYLATAALWLAGGLLFAEPLTGLSWVGLWLVFRQSWHRHSIRHVPGIIVYLLAAVAFSATGPGYVDTDFHYAPLIARSLVAFTILTGAAFYNHRLLLKLQAIPMPSEQA